MTHRTRGLVFPVLLIAIGIIFLLVNTGVLSPDALQRLGDLWPLILVILGLQLVLNHTLSRPQARVAGLAAAALIIVAAVAYALLAPAAQLGMQHQESSEPLQGLTAATLDLRYSGATIDLHAAALGNQLFTAQVDYPSGEQPPDVTLNRRAATLDLSGGGPSPFHLFGGSRERHLAVTLTNRIPWSVKISGGAAAMTLDLASLPLSRLEISGGASRVDVSLPKPTGPLVVDVSGGATSLSLRAPAGSEWRVSVSGGVSSLDINGNRSGAIGDLQHQSPGYAGATDRLTIDVSGGVSQVDFRTG
ncbi:MAG: DUF5668 domain-containing protein [Candidatus Dormibacter sp.]